MEQDLFLSRVRDTQRICYDTSVPKYLGFLSPAQAAQARAYLSKSSLTRFAFFGGYEQAERTFLACLPDWCEEGDFPIRAITFLFRESDSLSHRDFLGTVMSLGLKRETVGDILVEKGRAVLFASVLAAEHILRQVGKVGGCGVTLREGFEAPLPEFGKTERGRATAASARIDCVAAAVTGLSRAQAVRLIESGMVSVNSEEIGKITARVQAGDRLSVRGKGKFLIADLSGLTRKGRLEVVFDRYV